MSKFKPSVWYNEDGDHLEITWSEEAGVAHWKNKYLTLMRSMENPEEIVGIIITNFRNGFIFSGLKLDNEYDEGEPLTPKEETKLDEMLTDIFG